MPFDASGNFTRNYNFVQDAANGIKILAARVDGEFDNIATGMNAVFFRDGRVPMQADLRLNINGITGLKDGTLGSPAIKFNTDAGTGIYLPGLNQFGVQVNSLQRGVFTTAGFDVTGNFTATGNIAATGTITQAGAAVATQAYVTAFDYMPKAGGTFTGAVNGTSFTAPSHTTTGVAGAGLYINPRNGASPTNVIYSPSTGQLNFYNGTADQLTLTGTQATFSPPVQAPRFTVVDTSASGANITFNGNGATTPNKSIRVNNGNLEVVNSAYSQVIATISDAGSATFQGNNLTISNGNLLVQHDGSNGFIRAQTGGTFLGAAGTTTLSLASSGDVQLPTNNKQFQFTDASGGHPFFIAQSDNNFAFYSTDAAGSQRPIWSVPMHSASGALSIYPSTQIAGTLTVTQEIATNYSSGQGIVRFGGAVGSGTNYLWYDGTQFQLSKALTVAGNITSSSDARLKSNVHNLDDGLALVRALQPKRFIMHGKPDFGLIAQEVEPVLPEVVSRDSKGYLSIDYGRLTAVLAGAVASLDERLQAVERLLAL